MLMAGKFLLVTNVFSKNHAGWAKCIWPKKNATRGDAWRWEGGDQPVLVVEEINKHWQRHSKLDANTEKLRKIPSTLGKLAVASRTGLARVKTTQQNVAPLRCNPASKRSTRNDLG
jgi:hypothetical protein